MKLSHTNMALMAIALVFVLSACGEAQTPDLPSTAGVTAPGNLWEVRDPFKVKPASGAAYLLEIKPISASELPASFDSRDVLIFAAYHFVNGQEGKTVVLPVLSDATPSLEGFTLDLDIKYFQVYPVESQEVPKSIFEDAGKAMQKLCQATPNCQ